MANAVAPRAFSDQELREMKTYSDLRALVQERGLKVTNASDVLSDGFELSKDKEGLVGIEFVIVDWRFTESDAYGDEGEFVTVRLITAQNAKLIINDGSTGIMKQLKGIDQEGVLYVKNGLRVSEYEYTDAKGKKSKARTYYLSA